MPEVLPGMPVELKIPAREDFIGIAKRVANSLGGQLGFSLDEIDELSIAVTQACANSITDAQDFWGEGATLQLSFITTKLGIRVDVDVLPPDSPRALALPPSDSREREELVAATDAAVDQRQLAKAMIRVFVDDFREQVNLGRRQAHYRMVKHLIS